jgi:hypothetical protein
MSRRGVVGHVAEQVPMRRPRSGGGDRFPPCLRREPSASRLRPYLALRSFIVFPQKIRTKGSELSTPEPGMRWPYKTKCMGIISSADESTHCRSCRLGVCDGYDVLRSACSPLCPECEQPMELIRTAPRRAPPEIFGFYCAPCKSIEVRGHYIPPPLLRP